MTVKVIGGPVYTSKEIERLHYGPKPGRRAPRKLRQQTVEAGQTKEGRLIVQLWF